MNKAFVREPEQTADYCPRCGSQGKAVGIEALKCYLTDEQRRGLAEPVNLCPSPRCSVAYFDGLERVVMASELARPVYPKDATAPNLCLLRPDSPRHRTGRCRGGRHADQGGVGKGQVFPGTLSPDGSQRRIVRRLRPEILHGVPQSIGQLTFEQLGKLVEIGGTRKLRPPFCGHSTPADRRRCDWCGKQLASPVAKELSDLAAVRRQLQRFRQKGTLKPAAVDRMLGRLQEYRQQLLQPVEEKRPAPAVVPIVEKTEPQRYARAAGRASKNMGSGYTGSGSGTGCSSSA